MRRVSWSTHPVKISLEVYTLSDSPSFSLTWLPSSMIMQPYIFSWRRCGSRLGKGSHSTRSSYFQHHSSGGPPVYVGALTRSRPYLTISMNICDARRDNSWIHEPWTGLRGFISIWTTPRMRANHSGQYRNLSFTRYMPPFATSSFHLLLGQAICSAPYSDSSPGRSSGTRSPAVTLADLSPASLFPAGHGPIPATETQ